MKRKMILLFFGMGALSLVLFQNCGNKSYSPGGQVVEDSLDANVDSEGTEIPTDEAAHLDHAEKKCNEAFAKRFDHAELSNGASLVGNKFATYRGNQVAAIRDGNGAVVLIGNGGTDPLLDEIRNFKGVIILCGVSVAVLRGNSTATIYVVDGDVGNVADYTGLIVIKRGSLTGSVERSLFKLINIDADGKFTHSNYHR